MILKTSLILVLSVAVVKNVAGVSLSKVFVQTGPEVGPSVDYLQYGGPSVSYTSPAIAQLSGASFGSVVPFTSTYGAPCGSACVYPGQAIASPVVPSSNIVAYKSSISSLPVVYAANDPTGYEYSYIVYDQHTGDHKAHSELSDGSMVRGEYSFLQPDGLVREVQYMADDVKGFNAIVKNFLPSGETKVEHDHPTPPCHEVKSEALKEHEHHADHEHNLDKSHESHDHGSHIEASRHETPHGAHEGDEGHHEDHVGHVDSAHESELQENHEHQDGEAHERHGDSHGHHGEEAHERHGEGHKHHGEEGHEHHGEDVHERHGGGHEHHGDEAHEGHAGHEDHREEVHERHGEGHEQHDEKAHEHHEEGHEQGHELHGEEVHERHGEAHEHHGEEADMLESHKSHEHIVGIHHEAGHETHQAATAEDGVVEENILVPYSDIIRCIQSAISGIHGSPTAHKPESPLTYVILNKPC